jgi:hypothetical protein
MRQKPHSPIPSLGRPFDRRPPVGRKQRGKLPFIFSEEKMGFRLKSKKFHLKMNSSSTPANNENVAYGPMLAACGKLKRQDQVNLVRALAGQLGMIALFPAQLQAGPAPAAKAAGKGKKKGPAKQAPSNPLSGTAEKKDFDAAKKAVAKATKDAGGQKLPADHHLVVALDRAKERYFRALSSAKGKKTEDDDSSSDEEAAGPSAPPPPRKEPASKTPTPTKKTPSPRK